MKARIAAVFWLVTALVSAQEHSVYVKVADGTRLAVDVHLPPDAPTDARYPALLELTRYWRSSENARSRAPNPALGALDRHLLENGYALVKVDVRGSGASFGSRQSEYGTQEVRDGRDIVDWVVAQPWCSGSVGAYGTSYTGTTAELLCAVQHPAVKAVVPGWSDFDTYRSPARPFGLFAAPLIRQWGQMVGWLDDNESSRIGACVRRVADDADGKLRDAAVTEHAANIDVAAAALAAEFRDSAMAAGADTWAESSALHWREQIEASNVPMLVFASWLDAGTAEGALWRLQNYRNPQKLVILASSHGGGHHASPFVVGSRPRPPIPSVREQFRLRVEFLDQYLKGEDRGVADWPTVRYFNLGEEAMHETEVWPPAGVTMRRFHLGGERALTTTAPARAGSDDHEVDFGVGTGSANRWMTQMGRPVLQLDDRGSMDQRMSCYTTPPLAADLQVTGTPVVKLRLSSDHADGAVLVYLEDVDPDGRSRYVTEGGLRVIHRQLQDAPELQHAGPWRSFAEADAAPLVPDQATDLEFALLPTSVRFRRGHRIRFAIAGADQDSFARVPASGSPKLTVHWGTAAGSFVELPVVGR